MSVAANAQDSQTRFPIGWKGNYRVVDDAFVYTDLDTGRVLSILGYPIKRLVLLGQEISHIFG